MRLWLDNTRPAPRGWVGVRTVQDARQHLEQGEVEQVSLDYDLDNGEKGIELLRWMRDTGRWPRYAPKVHSGNIEGAAEMKKFVSAYAGRPFAPRPPRKLSRGGSTRYDRAAKQRIY